MANEKKRRSRSEIAADYGTTVRDIRPGESEVDYFKALAKVADQRMVRLEKLAGKYVDRRTGEISKGDPHYKGVLSYAYESAQYEIRALSGNPNATRFNIALKKNKDGTVNKSLLHAKINAVKRFLEAPTSIKSGIIEIHERTAATLSKNMDLKKPLTWQQAGNIFESRAYDTMRRKGYTSDQIIKAVGAINSSVKPADVSKALDQNIRVSDDAVINEVAQAIAGEQLTLADFIK